MAPRVTYSVRVFPLRLHAYFCRSGGTYVVSLSRKGVELATAPTLCTKAGELIFDTGFDARTQAEWRLFQVHFDTPKDLRNLSFSVYDFSPGRPASKIVSFAVPLSGMCSVLNGEKLSDCKGIAFRFTGQSCRLDTYFCMFPYGSEEPPFRPPSSTAAAAKAVEEEKPKDAPKTVSLPDTRTTRLPDGAVRSLQLGGLLPSSFTAVEVDADMAGEIAARAELLFPTRETLESRLQSLRKEVARLEYEENYGQKDVVRKGSGAATALREECTFWRKKMEALQHALNVRAGVASPASLLMDENTGTAPIKTYEDTRGEEIVAEIKKEQEKLANLEKEQQKRDVTADAMSCLSKIEALEVRLAELKHGLPATSAPPGASSRSGSVEPTPHGVDDVIKAQFNEEEGDCWDKLAAALYDAEAKDVEMTQLLLLLNRLQVHPYPAGIENGVLPDIPKTLDFVEYNARDLIKHENAPGGGGGGAGGKNAAGGSTGANSFLDDLFAPAAASPAAEPTAGPGDAEALFMLDPPQPVEANGGAEVFPSSSALDATPMALPVWGSGAAAEATASESLADAAKPSAPSEHAPEESKEEEEAPGGENAAVPPYAAHTHPPSTSEEAQPLVPMTSLEKALFHVSPPPSHPPPSALSTERHTKSPPPLPATKMYSPTPPQETPEHGATTHIDPFSIPLSTSTVAAASHPPTPPASLSFSSSPALVDSSASLPERSPKAAPHPTSGSIPPAAVKASFPSPGSGWTPPSAAAAPPAPHTSAEAAASSSPPVGFSPTSSLPASGAPSPPPSAVPGKTSAAQEAVAASTTASTASSAPPSIPRGPPPPRYTLCPTSYDEIPLTRFFSLDILASGCPIDIFLDGTTPIRGTELTLVNNTPNDIVIGGIELKEENMFSSDPKSAKVIPTRRWPQKLQIPGKGGKDKVVIAMHPSYPRGSALLVMINLYIWQKDRYLPVPGRFTV